jgi:hypothetical protein
MNYQNVANFEDFFATKHYLGNKSMALDFKRNGQINSAFMFTEVLSCKKTTKIIEFYFLGVFFLEVLLKFGFP